jgi:hypothetical protein
MATCLIIFMPCSEEKYDQFHEHATMLCDMYTKYLVMFDIINFYQLTGVHQKWIHLQRDVQRVSVSVTVSQALTHPTAALGD